MKILIFFSIGLILGVTYYAPIQNLRQEAKTIGLSPENKIKLMLKEADMILSANQKIIKEDVDNIIKLAN